MSLSKVSLKRLEHPLLDPRLKNLFLTVSDRWEMVVIETWRSLEKQREYYEQGRSRTLEGKHPLGKAVDAAPMRNRKIDWDDIALFREFAYYVLGVADAQGIPLRNLGLTYGWDYGHFELLD